METCEKEEDYFNRLPDDLIISHIFDKIPDAKCLLRCFMLSKRFAFLVLQSQTLSCTILRWVPFYKDISTLYEPPSLTKMVLRFFKKPVSFLRGLFRDSYPSCFDENFMLPLMGFIREFKSLKSINVEVAFSGINHKTSSCQYPILKWKFDYRPENSGTFVLMLAKSLAVATGVEEDDNDEAYVLSAREIYKHMRIFLSAGQDARLRCMVFEKTASRLPNQLQSAVITDSRKQGKVVLGEAKLVEMRNKNMVLKDNEMIVRVWNARVVRLPLSGYVMKGVTLHVLKFGIDVDVDDFEPIAEGAFEGEDGVFAEAATKLLKRKPASEEHARIIIP